jgi:hypothetical protein
MVTLNVVTGRTLSVKQEAFIAAYTETGVAAEAYRTAYHASNMSDHAIYKEASKLMRHPLIAPRITEFKVMVSNKVVERIVYDTQAAMQEAHQAFNLALRRENPAAMIAAVTLRAKLNGLIVDKAEIKAGPLDELSDSDIFALHDALLVFTQSKQVVK